DSFGIGVPLAAAQPRSRPRQAGGSGTPGVATTTYAAADETDPGIAATSPRGEAQARRDQATSPTPRRHVVPCGSAHLGASERAPVVPRRRTTRRREMMPKRRGVAEARTQRDLVDAEPRVLEELLGQAEALLGHPVVRRRAGLVAEAPCEGAR